MRVRVLSVIVSTMVVGVFLLAARLAWRDPSQSLPVGTPVQPVVAEPKVVVPVVVPKAVKNDLTPVAHPDIEELVELSPEKAVEARDLIAASNKRIEILAAMSASGLVDFLIENGVPVDVGNEALMERIKSTSELANKRVRAALRVTKAHIESITVELDKEGKYKEFPPGEHPPVERPKDRPVNVFTRLTQDGAKVYVIDSKEYPEFFEDREDRLKLIVESMVSEAVSVAKEHSSD